MKFILIVGLLLAGCATPGNRLTMEVTFADRDATPGSGDLPYAEEIQICVPKLDQTLKCASMMRTINPKKGK